MYFSHALINCTVAQSRNAFRVIENGVTLEAGSIISVGNASDVAIDIQCLGDVGTSWTWYIFPSYTTLPTPLDPSLTSYSMDSGVLRVFSSFVGERESDGVLDFVCLTHDSRSAVVGFRQCELDKHVYIIILINFIL